MDLSKNNIIIIVGLIASVLGIFVFVTGVSNVNQLLGLEKVKHPISFYKNNYSITENSVGGFYFGQSITEVKEILRQLNFKIEVDVGAEGGGTDFNFPTIWVYNKDGLQFGIISNDMKVIDGFEIHDSKYKFYNGVYPGITVKKLSTIYQHKLSLEDHFDGECFIPYDLRNSILIISWDTYPNSSYHSIKSKDYDRNQGANYDIYSNEIIRCIEIWNRSE